MQFPFKAQLQDLKYRNTIYVITVKNKQDWQRLEEFKANPQYTVKILKDKNSKRLTRNVFDLQ